MCEKAPNCIDPWPEYTEENNITVCCYSDNGCQYLVFIPEFRVFNGNSVNLELKR